MSRLNFNPCLTQGYSEIVEQQIRTTYSGQAHFANTGPFGATCGECSFYGYFRQHRNESGDVLKTTNRKSGCAKFHELTGKHGASVPATASACRYFERKS